MVLSGKKTTDPDADDDLLLKRLGYTRVLERGLSSFSNFAFGFSEVAVLASVTSLYGQGLQTGGPAGTIWGFVVVWAFNSLVAASLAEICSAYPSAGSVYHWSAQLSPPSLAPLFSFTTGLTNWIGNASGNAAFAFTFAIFLKAGLQSMHITAYDDASTVIVALGTNAVWTLLNFCDVSSLAVFNNVAAAFHTASLFIIIVTLFSSSRLQPASWVFLHYENLTGFEDDTLNQPSYIGALSVLTSSYYFSGMEASAHLAEETQNSSEAAPDGITRTVFATGIGGALYLLALLFATTDLAQVVATDDATPLALTDCAAANVFILSCGQRCGAALTWLCIVNLFFAGVSCVAVTGRITFALARDGAFPYSGFFSQVHPVVKVPIRAISLVCGCVSLLLLLPVNPDAATAFYSIVGLCTVGFSLSYAIPILVKVWFRAQVPFPPECKKSLGKWSEPCGVVAGVWLLGTSCLFFLPVSGPITPRSNNWLCVVAVACFLAAAL